MTTREKSFRECTLQYLDETFHLEEVQMLPALAEWLAMAGEISDHEQQQLIQRWKGFASLVSLMV